MERFVTKRNANHPKEFVSKKAKFNCKATHALVSKTIVLESINREYIHDFELCL